MVRTEDRFAALILPHLDGLYRLASRLTPRAVDAAALFQDALVALFERREELSSIGDLPPYLSRVLYNQFVREQRRYARARLELVGRERMGREPALSGRPDREEARIHDSLASALARLSEEHRIALVLADVEGLSLATIEKITDVPAGDMKARLVAARARLRDLLRSDGVLFVAATDAPRMGAQRDAM